MEKASPLFRQEAIENRLNRSLGSIRINVPMNYRIAGFGAFTIVLLLICFIFFAEMTEKTFLKGYLDADKGIITIESEVQGIIEKVAITEGESIKKGEIIYVITNPNKNQTIKQAKILKHKIINLKREYELKEKQYQALQLLFKKQFISLSELNEAESLLLEIKSKIDMAEYELFNFKQKQRHPITSPIDGIVTNIFYNQGQHIQLSKPLVHIIPNEVKLIARLYIPAREIGFVKKGQLINLKYDAYPSQRFGFYKATITEINQTVLTDNKEDKPVEIGEPYYKIKARLDLPYVNVYGNKVLLSHGMTLSAVISGNKKKIWRWVLDPLYSFRDAVS